jgi:hypothetical protein
MKVRTRSSQRFDPDGAGVKPRTQVFPYIRASGLGPPEVISSDLIRSPAVWQDGDGPKAALVLIANRYYKTQATAEKGLGLKFRRKARWHVQVLDFSRKSRSAECSGRTTRFHQVRGFKRLLLSNNRALEIIAGLNTIYQDQPFTYMYADRKRNPRRGSQFHCTGAE